MDVLLASGWADHAPQPRASSENLRCTHASPSCARTVRLCRSAPRSTRGSPSAAPASQVRAAPAGAAVWALPTWVQRTSSFATVQGPASSPHPSALPTRPPRPASTALVFADVSRALANLVLPNEAESAAVDARQEIDLRIGASFTRLQVSAPWGRAGVQGASVSCLLQNDPFRAPQPLVTPLLPAGLPLPSLHRRCCCRTSSSGGSTPTLKAACCSGA